MFYTYYQIRAQSDLIINIALQVFDNPDHLHKQTNTKLAPL